MLEGVNMYVSDTVVPNPLKQSRFAGTYLMFHLQLTVVPLEYTYRANMLVITRYAFDKFDTFDFNNILCANICALIQR